MQETFRAVGVGAVSSGRDYTHSEEPDHDGKQTFKEQRLL